MISHIMHFEDQSTYHYQISKENTQKIIEYLKQHDQTKNLITSLETPPTRPPGWRRPGNPRLIRPPLRSRPRMLFESGTGIKHDDDDDVEVPFPGTEQDDSGSTNLQVRMRTFQGRARPVEVEVGQVLQGIANIIFGGTEISTVLGFGSSITVFAGEVTRARGLTSVVASRFQTSPLPDKDGIRPRSFFESGEHDDKKVKLPPTLKNNLLKLPNGVTLTFGEIIAFAGDFYGIPESPICEEVNETSWESRFMDAFNTLARGDSKVIQKEVDQIRAILRIEENSVNTVLGRGDRSIPTVLDKSKTYNQPSDVYKYHGLWFTIQYDTILGGSWANGLPLTFGRMMKLAANNPDHFQPYSKKVWEIGHGLALQKATEAGLMIHARRDEALELLNEAYAISAFSCHFLTDSFAAGHIRVPRVELPAVITGPNIGNLLVHYQHDEDGKFGINVINEEGDRWKCFGDGTLFDEKSKDNKGLVRGVVKSCVGQVWKAFRNPDSESDPHVGHVLRKVPKVDSEMPNNYPLFTASMDQNGNLQVLRRSNVDDLSDSSKTNNWWGWSTVIELKSYQPKNSVV